MKRYSGKIEAPIVENYRKCSDGQIGIGFAIVLIIIAAIIGFYVIHLN
jgi:hypothetical protein